MRTYYTAVGNFRRKQNEDGTNCPIITVNHKEYPVDILKMVLLNGVPISKAKQLFQRDHPSKQEAQVIALSRQALLSTAELIKCAEVGASDISTGEKLMGALYNDDSTTSDNHV